jgi:hypothetical protein
MAVPLSAPRPQLNELYFEEEQLKASYTGGE